MPCELPGPCGLYFSGDCRLAWHSRWGTRAGIYPSNLLPSRKTTWHADIQMGANFPPPSSTFTMPGIGGLFINPLSPFNPPEFVHSRPEVHLTVIFAKTSNRFNIPYVVTQDDIDKITEENNGVVEIDVGDYIFDAIAVTDTTFGISSTLKELIYEELRRENPDATAEELDALVEEAYAAELSDIQSSNDNEADRAFRKLMTLDISPDITRLVGVATNTRGIEYRLDNGTGKSQNILYIGGHRAFESTSYRDGTSTKLLVDLTAILPAPTIPAGEEDPAEGSLAAGERAPQVGDTIYLSYLAVTKHYLRQDVNISFSLDAMEIPPICAASAVNFNLTNYRFFNWNVRKSDTSGGVTNVRLGGWRAVESYATRPNTLLLIRNADGNKELVDLPISGGSTGVRTVEYMPVSDLTDVELDGYIANRALMPRTDVLYDETITGSSYHVNIGVTGNSPSAYREECEDDEGEASACPWLDEVFPLRTYEDAIEHVLYNVHAEALHKRDVDKWAFEASLAESVQRNILSGQPTFVPFMDDKFSDEPTNGANTYLASDNCFFWPVESAIYNKYTNAYSVCCVGGSLRLGNWGFQQGSDQIIGVYQFHGNAIEENFQVGTRLWIERNASTAGTGGSIGQTLLLVEGKSMGKTVSCVLDPSNNYCMAIATNDDGYIEFYKFSVGEIRKSMNELSFRPDLPRPSYENATNPRPADFDVQTGYSGMMGAVPGFRPGRVISTSHWLPATDLIYRTTDRAIEESELYDPEQFTIEENISFESGDSITINVGDGYLGRTIVGYRLPPGEATSDDPWNSIDVFVLIKSGQQVVGSIDRLRIRRTNMQGTFRIDHAWMRGDTIEIVGENVSEIEVLYVTSVVLQSTRTKSLLADKASTSNKSADQEERLANIPEDEGVFFSTTSCSIAENEKSHVYIFFQDEDGGISMACSEDFGTIWSLHYGIVQPLYNPSVQSGTDEADSPYPEYLSASKAYDATDPFAIDYHLKKTCYLFFRYGERIFCKPIKTNLFREEDVFIVQRYETDLFDRSSSPPIEKASLYTDEGLVLRWRHLSYLAAGDSTQTDLLNSMKKRGRVIEATGEDTPMMLHENPIAISPNTALLNQSVDDGLFSAYVNTKGVLRLFFMGPTEESAGGESQLQCHFSTDGGVSWFNLWEYIEYGRNRVRIDSSGETGFDGRAFIDKTADGDSIPSDDSLDQTNPQERNQLADFGLNVHWSRLQVHKTEDGDALTADSRVIEIDAPYAMYQKASKKVFLFYFYKDCLLCKVFSDDVFDEAAKLQAEKRTNPAASESTLAGMTLVKSVIERGCKSDFVDGDLSGDIRNEIHNYRISEDSEPIVGNIVITHQFALDTFDSTRAVSTQRICASELPGGNVRVFYNSLDSSNLRAAMWNGSQWQPEDLMRDITDSGPASIDDVLTEGT